MATRARRQQIESAAAGLAACTLYDDETYAALAQRHNAEGWTLDTPGSQGHTIRHEGVVFSAGELAEVVRLAAHYQSL